VIEKRISSEELYNVKPKATVTSPDKQASMHARRFRTEPRPIRFVEAGDAAASPASTALAVCKLNRKGKTPLLAHKVAINKV